MLESHMLFEKAEKQFNIPSFEVDICDFKSRQIQDISEKNISFSCMISLYAFCGDEAIFYLLIGWSAPTLIKVYDLIRDKF
jgi:hypothetical protein